MDTLTCPACGGTHVESQIFQETLGAETVTQTKSKYKEKGHGCMWWLFIGWWWWIIDLLLWIFFFTPRLIIRLIAAPFKKKKYKGSSTSIASTNNRIAYKTMLLCKSCGHSWQHTPPQPPAPTNENAANKFSK